jgi:hypothetical protein
MRFSIRGGDRSPAPYPRIAGVFRPAVGKGLPTLPQVRILNTIHLASAAAALPPRPQNVSGRSDDRPEL